MMSMKDFKEVRFKWNFRDYQQRVLDNADKYILDGKINIVAAPGSGKTILGLELIRRCNEPCIILSPTTTIKYQWGERFESAFLSVFQNVDDYISYDLNEIKLLNSITYQALYSAMNKIKVEEEDESVDYSNIDLFQLIKEKNIKTICLDEAHHLQNEWQKALEKFIQNLNKDIKIISLTATPPYDAKSIEWERYLSVCGEIDEEIFVPELVKQKTLCPHQDYVYFNYPDESELANFQDYKNKVSLGIDALFETYLLDNVYSKIISEKENDYETLFSNVKEYISLLVLINKKGIKVDKKLIKVLTTKKELPDFNLEFAQVAVQFMLEDHTLLNQFEKEELLKLIKDYSLVEKGKVNFSMKEKLKKQLTSSIGKLKSINEIVKSETTSLKEELRMLILTDYIKKESLKDIGTENKLNNISVVSIFENIRRSGVNPSVGVLSGGLVILPRVILSKVKNISSYNTINETEYASVNIKGSNKDKVAIVSKLFEDGDINILIGTKSLLGEGWDSPCINSLILASFVGSFMLSNQMRGRAIRMYKNNPNKISNIWHLVTLEPDYIFEENKIKKLSVYLNQDYSKIVSSDYETLERRFDCFVGPSYDGNEITSGIKRLTIIKPPFNKEGIKNINQQMLEKSQNREGVLLSWETNLVNNSTLNVVNEIPKELKVPTFTYIDYISLSLLGVTGTGGGYYVGANSSNIDNPKQFLLLLVILAIVIGCVFLISKLVVKLVKMGSPKRTIKHLSIAVLDTLKETGYISYNAKVGIEDYDFMYDIYLKDASVHEQNVFNNAIKEMLSVIDNPRYLIVMKKGKRLVYKNSFACPSLIGQRKEAVEIFINNLKQQVATFDLFYTRNEDGRKLILKCRKKSFITRNEKIVNKKKKVVNYE